jgi:hypothetical protein
LPARYPDARFVDAGAAVLDHGSYADYLPCLAWEHCIRTRVRSPDGIHLLPPGAYRFGTAMAEPVISDFGL